MKIPSSLIVLIFVSSKMVIARPEKTTAVISTYTSNNVISTHEKVLDTCKKGKMTPIDIVTGEVEKMPKYDVQGKKFIILVNPDFKTSNFTPWEEKFFRDLYNELDTTNMMKTSNLYIPNSEWSSMTHNQKMAVLAEKKEEWNSMPSNKKMAELAKQKAEALREADSVHQVYNQGQQEVWLINNSRKKIFLPTHAGNPVIVLQALGEDKEWHTIRYRDYTGCGLNYSSIYLEKYKAIRIVPEIPSGGNFRTKLRFKLLADRTFYYSNEFDGNIDYCDFVESPDNEYIPDAIHKLDVVFLRTGW